MVEVKIKKLRPEAIIPTYANHGDAGMDIYSPEDFVIGPGEIKIIPTGLALEIPYGFELQIRPRSGLAAKHGISLVNTPGTLDAGFRGELKLIMINHSPDIFSALAGERIAQAVLNRFETAEFKEVSELSASQRGEGGLGSTGKK